MNRPHLYAAHFGLAQTPFGLTPQPDFFFGGAERENLLRLLVHFAEQGEGIALVSGEVGAGKTMLLTMLMQDCRKRSPHILPILINRMMLSPADLAYNLAEQLGVASTENEMNLQMLQSRIEARLIALFAEGRRTLVVVDEAHALSNLTLEWLRLLTNLETTQGKMLQLMLFGQPEILPRLAHPELRALADRITLNLSLRGMNRVETEAYLQHRLRHAGFRGDHLFQPEAVALLAKHTGGLLRRIHLLADKALLSAYAEHATTVAAHNVRLAIAESRVSGVAHETQRQRFQPAAEPEVAARRQQWIHLLQWLGAPSGMAWSGLFILFLIGGSWLVWHPTPLVMQTQQAASNAPSSLPATAQAEMKAVDASMTDRVSSNQPPLLHPNMRFQWPEAGEQTQKLLQQSPAILAQTFQQQPNGVLLRLISERAPPQQAEQWLTLLQQAKANEPRLASVSLATYRFEDNQGGVWRVVAVGYPNERAAQKDLPSWQNLIHRLLPSSKLSTRPLTSLLP